MRSQDLAHCAFNSNHRLASYDVCSYKHQACSFRTPPRDIDFSDVSLKTLLVLVHRRIFRPSHVHLLGGATVCRPHHCQPQWFANSRLGNHTAVPRCRTDDRAKCIRLCRCSASITMFFNLYNTIKIFTRLQRRQFCSVTSSLPSAMVGSGNFVILVLDGINLPLCTTHTSTSPESIHRYISQSVVLRSCVTAFSSWPTTTTPQKLSRKSRSVADFFHFFHFFIFPFFLLFFHCSSFLIFFNFSFFHFFHVFHFFRFFIFLSFLFLLSFSFSPCFCFFHIYFVVYIYMFSIISHC